MRSDDLARRAATDPAVAKHRLWKRLRCGQLGAHFAQQVALGPFVGDFVCHARRLVVDCDPSLHLDSPFDRARDARLAATGWHVLRIRSSDVLRNTDAVCAAISAALAAPSRATAVAARKDGTKAQDEISRPRLSARSDRRRSSAGPRP